MAISQIPSPVAWALASFAATLLYLGVASVEVALVEHDPHADAAES